MLLIKYVKKLERVKSAADGPHDTGMTSLTVAGFGWFQESSKRTENSSKRIFVHQEGRKIVRTVKIKNWTG